MHLFFDTCNCIGALPGSLIVGHTYYENLKCVFDPQKHFIIPESKLTEFMRILDELAKKIQTSSKDVSNTNTKLVLKEGIVSIIVSIIRTFSLLLLIYFFSFFS